MIALIFFAVRGLTSAFFAVAAAAFPLFSDNGYDRRSKYDSYYYDKYYIYRVHHVTPASMQTALTRSVTAHASAHCHSTRQTAHFVPSSRLTEATAAIQGV